jgi:hypothetical protein
MHRYKAVDGKGRPIVTVGAEDEEAARQRIKEQLDRPGRRPYYQRWIAGGSRIQQLDTR